MTAAVIVTMLGIVIGRFLGPECMAAYTLAAPITNLVTALSGLMTEGTQVLCALNLGKGNVKRARNFTLNQILLATAASTMAVGAFGALTVVQGFVSCVLIGVGMTTGMIAGMILGEQDRGSAERLVSARRSSARARAPTARRAIT